MLSIYYVIVIVITDVTDDVVHTTMRIEYRMSNELV